MAKGTCAHCGTRDAETLDDLGDLLVPCCYPCRDGRVPQPRPPTPTGTRVRNYIRLSPGADANDVSMGLGMEDEQGRACVSAALSRLVRLGVLEFQGGHNDRAYYMAGKAPRSYSDHGYRRRRRKAA